MAQNTDVQDDIYYETAKRVMKGKTNKTVLPIAWVVQFMHEWDDVTRELRKKLGYEECKEVEK